MSDARLVSIQVGLPRSMGTPDAADPLERPWRSAIFKSPVAGPVRLTKTNLEGDGQADRRVHGGEDKAVLAYAASHYPPWRKELQRDDFQFGAFGENFTLDGQDEQSVCVGDAFSIGVGVRVQVSQPRQPCSNLARRWKMKDLTALVHKAGRGGWYLRVLEEGMVEVGMTVALLDRPYPEWTVARAYDIMTRRREDPASAEALAACPLLSIDWREALLG